MKLDQYVEVGTKQDGMAILQHKNTGQEMMLKHQPLTQGLREIKAYRCWKQSGLVDFDVHQNNVAMLMMNKEGCCLSEVEKYKDMTQQVVQHMEFIVQSGITNIYMLNQSGIIHRNIDADHMLIHPDFSVEFIGFEEAYFWQEQEEPPHVNFQNINCTTAPEWVFGSTTDYHMADYYSFGATLKGWIQDHEQEIDFDLVCDIYKLAALNPARRKEVVDKYDVLREKNWYNKSNRM